MITELIKELLFPRKCVLCGRILDRDETNFCRECRTSAAEYDNPFRKYPGLDGHTAVWFYEENVRESLIRFKFHNRPGYASAYGPMLAMRILRDLPQPDVITWVPVSKARLRERGYDQAELLAWAVSRELDFPVVRLLEKHRDNPAQSGIEDVEARRANVRDVYRIADGAALSGKRVLLIDDILTTGSTAGECARILRASGADRVMLAVVASGRKHKNEQTPLGRE